MERPELMGVDLPAARRVCPHLRRETEGPAVRRVRTPVGDEAWLVSRQAEIRELLQDNRIGRSHPAPDGRARYAGQPNYDSVQSADHEEADAMHAGLRTLLRPHFTARRMLAMRPRIELLVEQGIDALLSQGPPADLAVDFSEPLIQRVLCAHFGVPDAETDEYIDFMHRAKKGDIAGMFAYLDRLQAAKRANPDDTLVSAMCAARIRGEEVGQMLLAMWFAGGAIITQISYGLMLLAEHPEQRTEVQEDPSLLPTAVEEMLRLSGGLSLPRYARENIEIGDVTIRSGDLVLLDMTRANYDATAFDDPTTLDITRAPNRHMSLGHAGWSCLGAPLVRQLLPTVFKAFLTRMPGVRPTQPVSRTGGPLSSGLPEPVYFTW
jgi:cytochrome P450 monooxygenase